jgi:hypothetical protein
MNTETALPAATEQVAEASDQDLAGSQDQSTETPGEDAEKPPEKSAHELRIEELEREKKRLQRGIDRRTRQLAEARASSGLTHRQEQAHNQGAQSDSEPLSFTRAELAQMVKAEAEKLAPTLQSQRAEAERRQGVIQSLEKSLGQERFDEVADDLAEAFGGLQDASGRPKPAMEAVFEADDPARVIEWLADPEHADEAERISKLGPIQAGKAIARLEDKLKAEKAQAKPQRSAVAAPLEPVKSQGKTNSALPQDSDSIEVWLEKERARMNAKGIKRYG